MVHRFERDRDSLLARVEASYFHPPSGSIKAVIRSLGYRFSTGATVHSDVNVNFRSKTVLINACAAPHRDQAITAAAKGLGHIRLHAQRDPEDYQDWWHWEASVYAAVWLCPRLWLQDIGLMTCTQSQIWKRVYDLASQLGCTPGCLRDALEFYELITWDGERVLPLYPRTKPA